MGFFKTFLNLVFVCTVAFLAGCVADSTKKSEVASQPGVVNRLIANNVSAPSFASRSQSIVTLSYTSLDSELAVSCAVTGTSNVTVTQACSCDGLGVCGVGVTGVGVYSGPGSFTYNVSSGSKTSTTGTASFTITAPPPGSNVPPTISSISAITTTEGVPVAPAFTVADSDSSVSCANVTAASSNTTLIPNGSLIVSGSGGNCTVTASPAANQIGSSNITLTLTDTGTPLPAQTATTTFTITVNAYNDAPTISTISSQVTNEDTPTSALAFTIGDVDSTINCSSVAATSSNTALVSNSNIVIGGSGTNCTATVSPNLNQSGMVTITLRVTDNGTPMPAKTATSTFPLIVSSVNDVPVIAAIATQTTSENIAKIVNFTITDVDSNLDCSSGMGVTSSNPALIPTTNIAFGGIAPNCTATITPVSNLSGSSTLVFTVSDNGFPMPIQTSSASFVFTVNQVNHAPTISSITTQTTNEDTVTSAIAFTIADSDSTIYCSNVTGTSNNTSVVANANIVVTGTAPNCVATITPATNAYGTVSITLTLTDNGTPMPALTATSVFNLTINAVNDAPVMAAISTQTTNQDTASAPFTVTISDIDSTLSCASSLSATSSNTTIIPNANIVFGGTAPACTATVTPATGYGPVTLTFTVTDNGTPLPAQTATRSFTMNVTQVNQAPTITAITTQTTNEDTATSAIAFTIGDSDSTIYCSNVAGTSSNTTIVPNENIVITGTAPNCTATITPAANLYGSVVITLTLTDNGTPTPAMTATSAFTLTINAVNDAPTISAITNKTTNQGTASSAIAFTINDVDSTLSCTSSVAMTSSNTTNIPNANVVFSGTAPNCSAVVTPATGYGPVTLTFTLTDNGSPLPAATATSAFTMTVTQVNQPPTISAITNKTTNEDTASSAIPFIIADSDSTISCNSVTASSSNTALIPNASVVITGTAPNCSAVITPSANATGSSTITLTVTDNGTPLPVQTATSVFVMTVDAVNDAPTISAVTNKSTDEDTPLTGITVTVADIDSTLSCSGSLSATSTNTTLIPNANVTFSGTAPNCLMSIAPAANINGSASITVTLTDNGTPAPALTATTTFTTTVAAVPDLTGTLTVAGNLSGVASSYSGNSYARTFKFTGITSDEALSSVEVCLGTASGSCDVSTWVEGTGYTTSGSAPTVTLGGTYKLKSGAGGAQTFTLSASCGTTTNYYYSVRATNGSSKISNVLSTPAWNFWEPKCLGTSTLAMWLDASEASTITIATGVSNWTDKSGNARTVTQATTTKQPVYSLSGLGTGLPGITFNGTAHILSRASFVYGLGSSSVFTVIKAAAIGANRFIFGEGNANANFSYTPFATTTSNTLTGQITNTAGTFDLNLPASSSTIFNNTIRLGLTEDTGSTFYTYSNGTSQSQAITNYTRSVQTLTNFRLGGRIKNATESGWIAGTIGEFYVTSGILSTLNRQKLEGYSAHKWGVSASLPGAHPYLNSAP